MSEVAYDLPFPKMLLKVIFLSINWFLEIKNIIKDCYKSKKFRPPMSAIVERLALCEKASEEEFKPEQQEEEYF